MKEQKTPIADKNGKLSMQGIKKRGQVNSDQVVDHETNEKIRKLRVKKTLNTPVPEKADNIEPDKPAHSDETPGSHSLSALHFFQNYHR